MFDPRRLRHAFLLFHLVLGAALLWGSVHSVLHLGSSDPRAFLIGTIEAGAAAGVLLVGVHGDVRGADGPATRAA
jgi:hypothetical protein